MGNFGQVWASLSKFGQVRTSQLKATNYKNGEKGRKNKKREKNLSGNCKALDDRKGSRSNDDLDHILGKKDRNWLLLPTKK